MNTNDGRKVKNVATAAPATPAASSASGPNSCLGPAADETDERDDHDERAGRGLAEREAVDHLRRRQPAVVLDGALEDVGQHRVRAAEGEERGLGEEPAHLREGALPAERGAERAERGEPDREPLPPRRRRPSRAEARVRGVGAPSSISAGPKDAAAAPCPSPREPLRGETPADAYPTTPAVRTIAGNGTSNAKMATKAATRSAQSGRT